MRVLDWCKVFSPQSDSIPVEVRSKVEVVARGKSCYWYAAHGGLELERKISSVAVGKELIVIHIK